MRPKIKTGLLTEKEKKKAQLSSDPLGVFMNPLCAASYPGQILYLCVRSDAGIAFFPAVLHIPQVEHTGNYVQQLLHRATRRGRARKNKDKEMESGDRG